MAASSKVPGAIQIEGLKEFNRLVRHAVDTELPKRIGQANKEIGQEFISNWLYPKPVPEAIGTGRTAAIRPSATRSQVRLIVGGAHRANHTPVKQWGKQVVNPFRPAPPRPYIIESARKHEDEIKERWFEAIAKALYPALRETV
jgi:hypothetical protein